MRNTSDDTTNDEGNCCSPLGDLIAFVIIYHYNCRDGQKVQQVNANGEPHDEKYEDNPPVGPLLIRIMFPFKHHPENECCKERRKGIHFTFYSAIPKRITEGISKSANNAGSHDGENMLPVKRFVAFLDNFSCKVSDRPK